MRVIMADVLPAAAINWTAAAESLAASPVQADQDTLRPGSPRPAVPRPAGGFDLAGPQPAPPESRGFILDVGCGAQPYRTLVNPGSDLSSHRLRRAPRAFRLSVPDTTYYQGDRWPVSDAAVDMVLCTETLEHVPDPPIYLAEAFRCLKPGGRILISPFRSRLAGTSFLTTTGDSLLRAEGCSRPPDSGHPVFARGNAMTVACYKVMALFLRLVMPQTQTVWKSIVLRVSGIFVLPFLILLAVVANLSLAFDGGDDCLGYTVIASARVLGSTLL